MLQREPSLGCLCTSDLQLSSQPIKIGLSMKSESFNAISVMHLSELECREKNKSMVIAGHFQVVRCTVCGN